MDRRKIALMITAFVCLANVFMDKRLLLDNKDEAAAQLQRVLQAILPGYTPSIERTEPEFLSGKLVLHNVVLHQADDRSRELIRIPRMEVEAEGFPKLTSLSLTAIDPEVSLRLDEDGVNLDLDTGGGETSPPLFDVEIKIERGRLRLQNAMEGMHPGEGTLLVDGLTTELFLAPDGSLRGTGSCRMGALFPPFHRLAPTGPEGRLPQIPNQRFSEISKDFSFELVKTPSGPVRASAGGRVQISETIRTLIPRLFQDTVWEQIDPRGGAVDVNLRVAAGEGDTHVGVSITPRKAEIKPKGFPIPITEIQGGEFQVNVALPAQGGPPKLLGVTWEGVQARVDRERPGVERGTLLGRGAAYPGGDAEGVTMYMFVDVKDLPLSDNLRAAFPPKIRAVYERFDPRGLLRSAKVQLFKGPHERDVVTLKDGTVIVGEIDPATLEAPILKMTDFRGQPLELPRAAVDGIERNDAPQISVYVPRVGGAISGMYEDIPVRLLGIQGHFLLSENANVEMVAEGRLDLGGTAKIRAMVMHGDLISVDVWGKDVPVGDGVRLVSSLPGTSPGMVRPFALQDGTIDFHTKVEKASPESPPQPKISIDVHGVSFMHEVFPKRLTGDGKLKVIPWLDDDGELEEIEMELDLALKGEGMKGSAKGRLLLPPEQGEQIEFESDLRVVAEHIDVGGLPTESLTFLEELGTSGSITEVEGWIGGPRMLEIAGEGDGLQAKLRRFPYLVGVDSFDVKLDGDNVFLRDVQGTAPLGGTFQLEGRVAAPRLPPGAPEPEPDLDVRLSAQKLNVEPTLIDALPEAVSAHLSDMRLRGPISTPPETKLHLRLQPGKPAYTQGIFELEGVSGYLDHFHEDMQALEDAPAKDMRGRIRVLPDRVDLQKLEGTFMDSPVEVNGSIAISEGPDSSFDISADLKRLTVNERARQLAGPRAAGFFEKFKTSGPVALGFRVYRKTGEDEVHVDLKARPQGMTVYPDVLVALPIVDVTGRVHLEDGEPVLVDIKGYLEPERAATESPPERRTTIFVRRDKAREWRFPGGGEDGSVYYVWVEDLHRSEDPKRRVAFERRLPPDYIRNLSTFLPRGSMDIEAWVYQPNDDPQAELAALQAELQAGKLTTAEFQKRRRAIRRKPIRWVAEVDLHDFGFTAGIPLDGINGKVRAQGRLAEFEKGSAAGEMSLRTLDWYKQTFSAAKIPFTLEQGVLSLGKKGAPFRAKLYDDPTQRDTGRFKGVMTYDFESGQYRGWLGLTRGRLASMMKEIDELKRSRQPPNLPNLKAELAEARRVGNVKAAARLEGELSELNTKRAQVVASMARARRNEDEEEVERLRKDLDQIDGKTGGKGARSYSGEMYAVVQIAGGGVDVNGDPVPVHGDGSLVVEDANLLDIGFLEIIETVVKASKGAASSKTLKNMELKFGVEPDRITIKRLRLSGDEMAVLAKGGYVAYDQRLKLTLVPFEAGYEVFEWVPFTGYTFTGTIDEFEWRTLPPFLSWDWVRKRLIGSDEE